MEPFSELIKSDKPVLVDFYADWCGPCKAMNPLIQDVARSIEGKGKVIKINIDKNENTARQFQVQAVPTFMIFRNGQIIWRHQGMIDKGRLLSALYNNFS